MTELRVKREGATRLEPVTDGNALPVAVDGTASTSEAGYDFGGFESVTVSSTAIGLTPNALRGFTHAFITVETAIIRFNINPEAVPTASVGHEASVGDIIKLFGVQEVANFRAIRRDGTDATLRVSYGS